MGATILNTGMGSSNDVILPPPQQHSVTGKEGDLSTGAFLCTPYIDFLLLPSFGNVIVLSVFMENGISDYFVLAQSSTYRCKSDD